MYRIQVMNGVSGLPFGRPICLKNLNNAIAVAMAVPASQRAFVESWNGLRGEWVRQMERTPAHVPPEGFGRKTTPPTLRFCRDEAGCTHLAPPDFFPYDMEVKA